jgi:hypothetical protein
MMQQVVKRGKDGSTTISYEDRGGNRPARYADSFDVWDVLEDSRHDTKASLRDTTFPRQ